MKSIKVLSFFVTLILLFNCKTIVKKAYDVKNPEVETQEKLVKYLDEYDMTTSKNLVFKSFMHFAAASQKGMLSIPDIMLFNADGYYVNYKKKPEDCNAKVDDFLLDLKHFSSQPYDDTKTMDDFTKFLQNEKPIEKTEINAFITWAIFAGKLNKDKAFDWVNLINDAKQKGIKINYYLVNCDLQTSWDLTDEEIKQIQN